MKKIDYLNTPDSKIIDLLIKKMLTDMLNGSTFPEAMGNLPEDRPLWFDNQAIRQAFLEELEIHKSDFELIPSN